MSVNKLLFIIIMLLKKKHVKMYVYSTVVQNVLYLLIKYIAWTLFKVNTITISLTRYNILQ